MMLLRASLILGLVFAVASDSLAAKAKKKKQAGLTGVVTAVEPGKDSNKDGGTVTIKTFAGKKKANAATNGEEKKFLVTKGTTIEKVSGKKGQQETKTATFADIQNGARVVVTLKTGVEGSPAEKVQILEGKKKKKNANAD
jgi:hypothetical protein